MTMSNRTATKLAEAAHDNARIAVWAPPVIQILVLEQLFAYILMLLLGLGFIPAVGFLVWLPLRVLSRHATVPH